MKLTCNAAMLEVAEKGGPELAENQCIRHLIHRHEPPALAVDLKVRAVELGGVVLRAVEIRIAARIRG